MSIYRPPQDEAINHWEAASTHAQRWLVSSSFFSRERFTLLDKVIISAPPPHARPPDIILRGTPLPQNHHPRTARPTKQNLIYLAGTLTAVVYTVPETRKRRWDGNLVDVYWEGATPVLLLNVKLVVCLRWNRFAGWCDIHIAVLHIYMIWCCCFVLCAGHDISCIYYTIRENVDPVRGDKSFKGAYFVSYVLYLVSCSIKAVICMPPYDSHIEPPFIILH